MIAADRMDSTEGQFRGNETSLGKFGSCCHDIIMASSKEEADGWLQV